MATRTQRKISEIFEVPSLSTPEELISAAELDFFKEQGFLVKRNILNCTDVNATLDKVWSYLLKNVPMESDSDYKLSREDRDSWCSPKWGHLPPAPKTGFYEGRQPIVASRSTVKLHDIGSAKYIVELVPNNPTIRAIASQILAENLRRSERTRGVYALFPSGLAESKMSGDWLGPHADRVCQQLNVCVYLDDVPPRSGGFTLYPGSHKIMFNAHQFESNWSPLPNYPKFMDQVVDEIVPVELSGEAGDVIFWHGRMVHSAGIHVGSTIRWAVFGDFSIDRPVQSDDEHRAVGQYEWFKDTRLYKNDYQTSDDMWRNWRLGNRQLV